MSYYLFLDDERDPEDVFWVLLPQAEWVIVRNATQFRNYITENGIGAHISFDNDLGPKMLEGRHCAAWLVEEVLDGRLSFPDDFRFTVHSKNPIAAEWITQYLTQFLEQHRG